MQNISRNIDSTKKSKLKLFEQLIKQCYFENVTHSQLLSDKYNEQDPWCPRTFDGFACWDDTPSGVTAYQACPEFVVGFDPRRFSFKRCTENGTWYMHPETQKPWTNYTTCIDVEDLDFRNVVNNIYVIGYSVSVAALLLSIAIFLYFRTLQCTRIRIHMHLFAAFALNNILWIVWYKTVVNTVTVLQGNEKWCQALHVITNYFMVTSYFWMFCEGLHLHIALVVVFVKDEVAMRWFIALGWGLSLVVMIVYAVSRYYAGSTERNLETGLNIIGGLMWFVVCLHITEGSTLNTLYALRCWTDHSDTFWIIVMPVVISLFASFVFLINVVRVLLTKLHPAPTQHASIAAKKATRAALILIPLFGLHFILIPLRPSPEAPGEKLYQITSALMTSLQGLCVAVLFCFTNHDVMTATRTHMSRLLRTTDNIPMTGVTAGESLVNTRENVV